MAKRPETRWFVVGVGAQLAIGFMLSGLGYHALRDRYVLLGLCFSAGGVGLLALGSHGVYRWRVRFRNGHGKR